MNIRVPPDADIVELQGCDVYQDSQGRIWSMRNTFVTSREVWSCSADGPRRRSRANWCDAGCGSDYNQMEKLVPLNQ